MLSYKRLYVFTGTYWCQFSVKSGLFQLNIFSQDYSSKFEINIPECWLFKHLHTAAHKTQCSALPCIHVIPANTLLPVV
jgi:hypothetical protein